MFRKIVLFVIVWLGLWSPTYGQSYSSASLKTLIFPTNPSNTLWYAPSATAYMAKDINSNFFYFGAFEYHKYFYVPIEYPTKRPSFLSGLGFKNKYFSVRFGLGTGENLDYLGDVSLRVGDNVERKKYIWSGEAHVRYGMDNTGKGGEILAYGSGSVKLYKLLELGLAYSGKKYSPISSTHWWGPKVRSEIDKDLFVTLELLKWRSNIFGTLGVQVIFF